MECEEGWSAFSPLSRRGEGAGGLVNARISLAERGIIQCIEHRERLGLTVYNTFAHCDQMNEGSEQEEGRGSTKGRD